MKSKLEGISDGCQPRPINHKDAVLVEDYSDMLKEFFTKRIDYDVSDNPERFRNYVLATRLFVKNEVDVICGFSNDYLAKYMNGNEENILVGKWIPYKESGLYVRFSRNQTGICLASQGGHFDDWTFESRKDHSGRGFLHADYISYPSMERALKLSEKFLESIDGYSLVASARNPKTKPLK